MSRGGCAGGCSRGRREARPKSVIFTSPVAGLTRMLCGLEILVDDALLVNVRDRRRDADREAEEALDRHRRPEQAVERLAAEVLQDEGRHALVRLEGERLDDGLGVEQLADLVLVLQPLEVLRAAALGIEHLEDHRAAIGAPDRAIEDDPVLRPLRSEMV